MSSILRAAWVPDDDPERDWEIAADLAVEWVRRECAEQRAGGVLVLNAFGAEQQIPSFRRFAAEHTVTTPRASRNRVGRGTGPVLAYVPDERTLDFAAGLARGSSLAVVEGVHSFPFKGWARQLGAVDLTRPDEQPEELDSKLSEAINRLDFYKNNGFGDQFGKQQAQRILADLRSAGMLERDAILGALAARGASARGVRNLGRLIDALDRR
ncbi:hypothetical protein [Streptomyces lydicus]|uniref:hypothetical protein n=1 Tax=Streptomyces lydicus TaxID=47763 RepID=UPI000F8E29E5|nr:hypothetical protein [Streptomyces lydicus]